MAAMPRVQEIVLPILRDALPLDVKVGTWVEDVDYRQFPMIHIRRMGGIRHRAAPGVLSFPIIEMTAFTNDGLISAERLYEDALEALYEAAEKQISTDAGYLHLVRETMGATQFSSLFADSWRVQGLIQLGIRPPRNK